MEVKLQLKHIIIVSFVFLLTFGSILSNYADNIYNPTLDVSFINDNGNFTEESDASQIWNTLEKIQDDYNENPDSGQYETMSIENSNLSQTNASRISDYAKQNQLVITYGDTYNAKIEKAIQQNPNTYFVLIDSNASFTYPNVKKIEIDKQQIVAKSATGAAKATHTNKIAFVGTNNEINTSYNAFVDEVHKTNSKAITSPVVIKDVADNVQNQRLIKNQLDQGVDTIYIANRQVNKVATQTAKNYQIDILKVDNQIKAKKKELSDLKEQKEKLSSDNSTSDSSSAKSTTDEKSKDNTDDEESTDSTDTTETVEQKIKDTNDEIKVLQDTYIQPNINVLVNGSDSLDDGQYDPADAIVVSNKEKHDTVVETSKEDLKSIIYQSVITDYETELNEVFKEVYNHGFKEETYYLNFKNKGLTVSKE